MKHIACSGIGLVLSLGLLAGISSAQSQPTTDSQNSSLGEYARQIKKTPGTTSKPKVFDNDNLPQGEHLSIVGPAPAATTSTEAKTDESGKAAASAEAKIATDANAPKSETKTEAKTEGKGETKPEDKAKAPAKAPEEDRAQKEAALKQWSDKLASQKEQIGLLERELNVLQREYQIRAAAMYADAGNRMRNESNWDQQDAQYKQQIADKQKALADAKQKLEDMQEEARKAGVSASVREQ